MSFVKGDTVRYKWDPVPAIVILAYRDEIDIQFADGRISIGTWDANVTRIPKEEYFREVLKLGNRKTRITVVHK